MFKLFYMFSTDEEYRSAILDFFSLSDFDEEAIIGKTNLIYEKVKDIECFQIKMREAAAQILSEDMEMGLVILFSYDYFQEFRSLLEKHEITVE